MVICSTCGAENRAEAKVCRLCSVPLPPGAEGRQPKTEKIDTENTVVFSVGQVVCLTCHAENEEGWVFCQSCGSKLRRPAAEPLTANEPTVTPGRVQFHEAIDRPDQRRQPAEMKTVGSGSLPSSCPACSKPIPPRSQHCPSCGAAVPVDHTVAMASYRPGAKATLRLIIDDGKTGEEFELGAETVLGRVTGDITFPDDDYMSGRHARIVRIGNRFVLADEGSRNGTFIRITGDVELKPGDMILVGKQLFRFEV